MLLRLLLIILPATNLVAGEWQRPLQDFADRAESMERKWPNHGLNATLWGAIQSYRSMSVSNKQFPKESFYSDFFEKGSLEVGFNRGKGRKRLIVIVSGFGSDTESTLTRRATYHFASRGHHVLTIPNPWSADYLARKPFQRSGSVIFEAKLMLDLTRTAVLKLGKHNVSAVDVYGESYGGFIAAIMAGFDQERKTVSGRIFIVSPPVNIKQAFTNLDELIHLYNSEWKDKCSGIWNRIYMARDHAQNSRQSELTPFTQKCSPSLMIEEGFYFPLQYAIKQVNKTYGLKKLRWVPWSSKPSKDEFNFRTSLPVFFPEAYVLQKDPKNAKIAYWLQRVKQRDHISLIYADNDFLNRGLKKEAFEELETLLGESFIPVQWGGHLGLQGLTEWSEVLTKLYGKPLTPFHKLRWYPLGFK